MTREALRRPLRIWFGSRLAVVLLTFAGAIAVDGTRIGWGGFVERWNRWDAPLFLDIARNGYFSGAAGSEHWIVFFPGTPLLVRAVHVLVPDWVAAALVVSALAGAVAAAALWQLAADEHGPDAGDAAVLALVTMPFAVFLFAGYSEPVFLAFAATAWLAARRGRWRTAGLLAAGAALTRVTAAPLLLGLAVLYVVQRRGARVRADAAWLALPAIVFAGYHGYLRLRTGRWDAYAHALEAGWGRETVDPVTAFRTTWTQAFRGGQGANYLWSWRVELLALVIGVVLTVLLARGHRWAEATYVGSNTAMLSLSSFYASNVRALLVWFPLWVLLGGALARRPALRSLYLWTCAPLAAAVTLGFTRGAWVG